MHRGKDIKNMAAVFDDMSVLMRVGTKMLATLQNCQEATVIKIG